MVILFLVKLLDVKKMCLERGNVSNDVRGVVLCT